MKILRKITPKTVIGDVKKLANANFLNDDGEVILDHPPVMLYRIIGIVSGTDLGKSDFGDYVGFTGEFEVTDADGAEYYAPKAFFPKPIQGLLQASLGSSDGDIEAAFVVFIAPSSNAIGYEYSVSPLIEPKPSSRLEALNASILALEGPRDPVAPTPAKKSGGKKDGKK